jgi:uncharacterized membrane protein YoaK (UPF0700 family)
VNSYLAEIRQIVVPGADERHGPLPPLLLALTLVTGLVDSFSYLVLGHVFVANMTGNVILLGFALVGSPGFSVAASLAALGSFWVGAVIGGAFGSRLGEHRGRLLGTTALLQAVFVAGAVAVAALSGDPVSAGYRYPLIIVLGIAMGLQNAAARKLAVPDLTTTVLTMTITGTAADSSIAGGKGSHAGRRLTSLVAMFVGALVGAVLVIHSQIVAPLAIALAVIVGVGVTARATGRSTAPWVHP